MTKFHHFLSEFRGNSPKNLHTSLKCSYFAQKKIIYFLHPNHHITSSKQTNFQPFRHFFFLNKPSKNLKLKLRLRRKKNWGRNLTMSTRVLFSLWTMLLCCSCDGKMIGKGLDIKNCVAITFIFHFGFPNSLGISKNVFQGASSFYASLYLSVSCKACWKSLIV